jgi:hypothetical protein
MEINMTIMKRLFKLTMIFFVATLAACGAIVSQQNPYRPAIMENAVDMNQFEKDLSDCEKNVKSAPSNMESTNSFRFRECLVKKGYQLLS